MFGFFRKKSKSPKNQSAADETAPGTEISYNPDLINNLKHDHQELLGIYADIQSAFEKKDYALVKTKLNDFRSGLQNHLLTENVRLYIYLDHQLSNDETNSQLIKGFRREMDGIGRAVMGFLGKYETIGVDEDLAEHFATDFKTIGEVLGARIEKEESVLYPLYMPHY